MANIQNLKQFKKGKISSEEARRNGSKGGKASVIARRNKKTMREMLEFLLEKEIENSRGEKKTTMEAMMSAMVAKSIKGDVKASTFIRDTIGQKPVEKKELTGANGAPLEAPILNILPITTEKKDD